MGSLRGIAFKLGAVTMFMVMASLIKASADSVPPGQAVFFRSLFAFPILIGWLAMRGELKTGFRANNPLSHVWRGLFGTCAMSLNFAALGMLPLPDLTAIKFATPLFIVVLAALILGERVRLFRLSCVGLGLVGVLIVIFPQLSGIGSSDDEAAVLGVVLALGSAAMAAFAHVFIRKMSGSESTSAIVFWFTLTSLTISLFTIPFGWVLPTPDVAVMLVLAGLFGGCGQIMLTSAYRHADASIVAPFDYFSMLLALLIGYFVFGESPTNAMLAGAALVILSGAAIIWREHQLGLRRTGRGAAGRQQG
jgi:drug/metabolite transporter (DMT)-like permease